MTATEAEAEAAANAAGGPSFDELAGAVDSAVADLAELDDVAKQRALALKDSVEAFHKPALVHLVRTLRDDPRGKELLFELVDDSAVRAVFALHGIIKTDPMTRANAALVEVRPYLQSHGGDVELVRVENGTAFVRLQGSCNGCSMSAVTLREGVEEALVNGVAEVEKVEVLEDEPTAAFIPLSSVGRKPAADTGWVKGPASDEVAEGTMARFDVVLEGVVADNGSAEATSESFVVTNVDNRFAVFRNACVHQGLTLDGGMMDDGVIICPWHGFKFEASSGECISAPGAQLQQVPTRIEDGHVWVRARGA